MAEALLDLLFGGIAGITATTIIQPIDTIKVRIQIISEAQNKLEKPSPIFAARKILETDGPLGFYKGLSAAWFRQATYGSVRMGLYKILFKRIEQKNGTVTTNEKITISLFSGFLSSLVGNPSDLALVRFQSDSYLPANERRNYKHIFDALIRIVREEGIWTLWRGSAPTVCRAMSMNLGMMATNDEVKEMLAKFGYDKKELNTRLISAALSGVACSFLSLPFDNIKTKLQKMSKNAKGQYPYTGVMDCLKKTVQREGITGLWVGYPTYYCRVAPHAMTALMVLEELNIIFKNDNRK